MYATCLFCHAALGTNESIEHFPVGKRLAFDSAKGRLWVVCRKCERWNLSPLDERFEAIEEAERAYRDTKKRVTTDHVGLARLRDGTDLIRIGEPLRPEFAAWRYGNSFTGRRRRELIVRAGLGAGLGAGAIATIALSGSIFGPAAFAGGAVWGLKTYYGRRSWKPGLRLPANDGSVMRITGLMVSMSSIIRKPDGDFAVNVIRRTEHSNSPLAWMRRRPFRMETAPYLPASFTGAEANRVLSVLMPAFNRSGGGATEIDRAVQIVGQHGSSPQQFISSLSADELAFARHTVKGASIDLLRLDQMPAHVRLALEMSLHEESERRALQGELHELTQRWKEAEEIAAISDSMFSTLKSGAPSD